MGLPHDLAISLQDTYPKNKNSNVKRYMHPTIYNSIIYNDHDMEAI